jgi:hypothetical protein
MRIHILFVSSKTCMEHKKNKITKVHIQVDTAQIHDFFRRY